MALVDVISKETEAQIRATMYQAQVMMVTLNELACRLDKLLERAERVADAVGVVK